MDSILNSIKKLLGIPLEQTNFDPELIMHINSVFTNLKRLGVGPEDRFSINDEVEVWDDFIPEESNLEDVKTYMYLKVRLLFDPPASAAYLTTIKEAIKEYEWQLNVEAENNQNGEL